MKTVFLLFILYTTASYAQQNITGIVADSSTRQLLPFATVQAVAEGKSVIAGINGRFVLPLSQAGRLRFSHSGYRTKTIASGSLVQSDTVFLSPATGTLEAVVIRSNADKIRRILNLAIQNKSRNNPEGYDRYECSVYYKMLVDIMPTGRYNMDSIRHLQDSTRRAYIAKRPKRDTVVADTTGRFKFKYPSHVFLTESYSRRAYKKPQQVQEVIMASRTSGLSKTYFANIITDVLPFHVYNDFISLNSTDYSNPIAAGWQSRYQFVLEDEVLLGEDTVFVLRYLPREKVSFNALSGLVYINSAGYAISHFTGTNTTDSTANRVVKFEHIYQQVNGRWFPQELNYDFAIRQWPSFYEQVVLNGRSRIDSVIINQEPQLRFDKAHAVKFSDSVDKYTAADWQRYRRDSLTLQEANTYQNLDSAFRLSGAERYIAAGAKLSTGRLSIGKLDVDINRLAAFNRYEGTRLGLGLYTSDKISKYVSVGGWWGYGFTDKAIKWGASAEIFPAGNRESSVSLSYQKNIRLTGEVLLHPELSTYALRNWLLQQVDVFKEYALSAKVRAGYWEMRPMLSQQDVGPLQYDFRPGGKDVQSFTTREASLGLRYAYGERRVPFFDTYFSQGTRYPVVYASLGLGRTEATGYGVPYQKMLAAITYTTHINRWGSDRFWVEGGWVRTEGDKPLPRSLLLAGKGFNREGLNFYAWGGFLTMKPFAFYAGRYTSFFYQHSFDKNFWDIKWSKPFLSLAHNLIYGDVNRSSLAANGGLKTYDNGYHESGLLFNRLLRFNLRFTEAQVHAGCFYHWDNAGTWRQNAVWVVGLSTGF